MTRGSQEARVKIINRELLNNGKLSRKTNI